MTKTRLRFTRSYGQYFRGDEASFGAEHAAEIVAKGLAVPVTAAQAAPADKAADPPGKKAAVPQDPTTK